MEDSAKLFDYQFIIRTERIKEVCSRNLGGIGITGHTVSLEAIRCAERLVAAALAPLRYSSVFVREAQIQVTLSLREFPTGYYWFDRDLGAAISAAVIAAALRNRRKTAALWRKVCDTVCANILRAAAHPEIRLGAD